ncbi:MAG: HigA family addiction module antitoxin [Thermoanaerobaculia bacterium]
MAHEIAPVHPGEILMEEFLRPLGLSQYRLAIETRVPPRRINEIVKGQRAITPDTALRLARYFGTSEMFWLNLQAQYDLDVEKGRSPGTYRAIRPLADSIRDASPRRARKVK